MITFEEASKIVQGVHLVKTTEQVRLQHSINRVLAEDFLADSDVPAFDRSRMDGFACRKADLGNILKITGEIPAGTDPSRALGRNECMRIMTGGKVPVGADHILKKEDAEELGEGQVRCKNVAADANIRLRAEDLSKGNLVLPSGTFIRPQHIALLASGGLMHPLVYRRPTLAVISTGSELVDPEKSPGPAQIRESNGYQLAAQAAGIGLDPIYLGIARDDKSTIKDLLSGALNTYDITLISGGVSVGEHDHVPDAIRESGADVLFHRMMVKPGRHLLFGVKDNHFVFGFPGNPVSSFVQFEMMIRPFIMQYMGCTCKPEGLRLPLAEGYAREPSQLTEFLPVIITTEGEATIVNYHGSAHIHAYAGADGIMSVQPGCSMIKKGEKVHVRPL